MRNTMQAWTDCVSDALYERDAGQVSFGAGQSERAVDGAEIAKELVRLSDTVILPSERQTFASQLVELCEQPATTI